MLSERAFDYTKASKLENVQSPPAKIQKTCCSRRRSVFQREGPNQLGWMSSVTIFPVYPHFGSRLLAGRLNKSCTFSGRTLPPTLVKPLPLRRHQAGRHRAASPARDLRPRFSSSEIVWDRLPSGHNAGSPLIISWLLWQRLPENPHSGHIIPVSFSLKSCFSITE